MVGRRLQQGRIAFIYILTGVLLIALMAVVGISAFLRIIEIDVEGASVYTPAEIIEACGISTGDNLLFINIATAERKILTTMPIINDVKITRKPPDTLRIEVTESSPIATIAFFGDTLIIDSTGRTLKRGTEKPEGLIEVRGVALDEVIEGNPLRAERGAEMRLQYMQDVLTAIEKEGLRHDVSYLDVSNINNIHFGYLDMYRVIIGGPSNVRQKLSQLPGGIPELESKYPNIAGDIIMSDPSGEVKFAPSN